MVKIFKFFVIKVCNSIFFYFFFSIEFIIELFCCIDFKESIFLYIIIIFLFFYK